jgi:hypothetical protein
MDIERNRPSRSSQNDKYNRNYKLIVAEAFLKPEVLGKPRLKALGTDRAVALQQFPATLLLTRSKNEKIILSYFGIDGHSDAGRLRGGPGARSRAAAAAGRPAAAAAAPSSPAAASSTGAGVGNGAGS